MFNSKYSKVLTVVLVIAIFIIIGLLVYVGVNWYKAYTTNADIDEGLDRFDGFVNNEVLNNTNNTVTKPIANEEINNVEELTPDIDPNNTVDTPSNNNNSGNSNNKDNKPEYKGFKMVGKIEIPKINVKYPVLEEVTPKSIEVSVAVLYGPGINEIGNTVIIGHNYRNGTFFSNNKKLSVGDKIYLTDLSGTRITYIISKKYTTGSNDFDYANRDTNGKRGITLSTCTDDSSKRLIIWAEEQ